MSDNGQQVPLIQDMSMIQQRVHGMDDLGLQALVADFEQFEADGYIGDCTLRREAEKIGAEVKDPHNVVTWMKQVAVETYRELYQRSRDRIAELEAKLAAERERREAAENLLLSYESQDFRAIAKHFARYEKLCASSSRALAD